MKKFFLTLVGAAVMAGSMAIAPEPAQASHSGTIRFAALW